MDNKQELASNAEKGIRTKLHRKTQGEKEGSASYRSRRQETNSDDVEEIEVNLPVAVEFAWDEKRGRKSSSNLHPKCARTQAVYDKLRQRMEGATSGGSR
jgi:hypothetical protein